MRVTQGPFYACSDFLGTFLSSIVNLVAFFLNPESSCSYKYEDNQLLYQLAILHLLQIHAINIFSLEDICSKSGYPTVFLCA